MTQNRFRGGFSFVELVISMALFVFLFAAGFMVVKSLFQSSHSSLAKSKATEKLKTVAGMIQNEAVSSFDTLEETDRDRTGFLEPQFRVVSTIGPINPTDRTRLVTLVVTYPTSPGQTSSMVNRFFLSNNLSGITGAIVKVRVVSSLTGNPVQDVLVSGPSQGGGEVQGYTNSNGECFLYNVLEGSPTARVRLNGQGIYAHFVPGPPPFTPTFIKEVLADNLGPGLRDLGTHAATLPGGLRVRVLDVATGNPVPDYGVRIYPRPGYVPTGTCTTNASCWLGPGFLNGLAATTDASGLATYSNLLPGQYYLVGMGTSRWTAWDKVLTSPGNNTSRDPHIVVQSELTDLLPTDGYTIQKGSFRAIVYDTKLKSGKYVYENPVTAGCTVTLSVNDDFSDQYDLGGTRLTGYSWNSSLVRNSLTAGISSHSGETDGGGVLTLNNIAPKILNSTATLPSTTGAELQAVNLEPNPGGYLAATNAFTVKDPYLPIMVKFRNGDPEDPIFLLASNHIWFRKTYPVGTPFSEFHMKLYTNDFGQSNANHQFGLMVKADEFLASAEGYIVKDGTNTFSTDTFLWSTVRTMWGANVGNGGIRHDVALDANYIDPGYWVQTTLEGSLGGGDLKHRFDISNLLPLGQQGFVFSAIPNAPIVHNNTEFNIPVKVWTKNALGQYVEEVSPNSGPTLGLRFRYPTGGWLATAVEGPDETGLQMVNGVISFNNRTTYGSDVYSATILPRDLTPGGVTDFENTPLVKAQSRRNYYISLFEDTSNQFDFVAPPFFPDWGYPHTFNASPNNRYEPNPGWVLTLARRAVTSLRVRVQDIGGNPIDGAIVVLSGHGMAQITQVAGSFAPGVCRFPDNGVGTTFSFSYRPVPASQSNLNVFVTAPSYVNSGVIWVPTPSPMVPDGTFIVTMGSASGMQGSN